MPSNRLLVIDDEPDSSAIIGRIARGCGYDVIITTETADCRSKVLSWEPSVIVLDLSMPEMDGTQLMTWLGQQGSAAEIVIVSGRALGQVREAEAVGRGCGLHLVGSLQKPLRIDGLRTILRKIYDATGLLSIKDATDALKNREIRLAY